jgi:hypothetical protein
MFLSKYDELNQTVCWTKKGGDIMNDKDLSGTSLEFPNDTSNDNFGKIKVAAATCPLTSCCSANDAQSNHCTNDNN